MTIESGESEDTLKITRQSRFRASTLQIIRIVSLMAHYWDSVLAQLVAALRRRWAEEIRSAPRMAFVGGEGRYAPALREPIRCVP
jgi:hypothetical protein